MAVAVRRRMYLFERAYVDYGDRIQNARRRLWETCVNIWQWFWSGPGATLFENILRIAVFVGGVVLCVLYVQYQNENHLDVSVLAIGAIFVATIIILWGYKVPVHIIARLVTGLVASGTILVLSILVGAVALVVFAIYLILLFILTALSFVVFLPMRGLHALWMLNRRITYRCPYDDCPSNKTKLPIHVCSCGHQYDDLMPSFYGIFYHTCRHDDGTEVKLPTMDFLGRNKKLVRLCASCHRPLIYSSIGELPERPIIIAGGPSAGKTVFMRQAVNELADFLKPFPRSTVWIDAPNQKDSHDRDMSRLGTGQTLAKTGGDVVQAVGVTIKAQKYKSLLLFYDPPGEDYGTIERFARKQILDHLAGIVLLIDPFSLPVLSEYAQSHMQELAPSTLSVDRVVGNLITGLGSSVSSSARYDIPVAVVLSKIDALPIRELPSLAGISANGGLGSATSSQCRDILEKLGGGNTIRNMELRFSRIQYFSCTALGRPPYPRSAAPFEPKGVVEPLVWLLDLGHKLNGRAARQ